MKLIGIIGGMSYEYLIHYYERITIKPGQFLSDALKEYGIFLHKKLEV